MCCISCMYIYANEKVPRENPHFFVYKRYANKAKGIVGWTLEFWFYLELQKKLVGLRNYSLLYKRDQDLVQLR